MEKISNFKTFSKTSADNTAIKIGEENEVKRGEIAERVKSVLSEMDISSLDDLTEEQKNEFVNNLFTYENKAEVEEAEEDEDEFHEQEVSEAEIKSDGAFRNCIKEGIW